MKSGGKSSLFLLCMVCTLYSAVADPSKSLNPAMLPTQSRDFDNKLPLPQYETPGNPPKSSPGENAYESLRDFSTSADQAFIKRRLFNTSVALTIPMFSFTLPSRGSEGSTVDLANQAIFGLFSLLVVTMVFTIPILFSGTRSNYDLTGRSNGGGSSSTLNHLMKASKSFNLMGADFTNQIGLDGQTCLQKTICEAHRFPDRYGLLSMPFRMFFPPPTNGTAESRASSYQLAAKDGKYSRKDCGKNYKCFFDILDLTEYFIDWWKYSSDPNYVAEF